MAKKANYKLTPVFNNKDIPAHGIKAGSIFGYTVSGPKADYLMIRHGNSDVYSDVHNRKLQGKSKWRIVDGILKEF